MMSKFDYELSVYIAKADISKRLKEIAIELSERLFILNVLIVNEAYV